MRLQICFVMTMSTLTTPQRTHSRKKNRKSDEEEFGLQQQNKEKWSRNV
jgi:hypothetical protein